MISFFYTVSVVIGSCANTSMCNEKTCSNVLERSFQSLNDVDLEIDLQRTAPVYVRTLLKAPFLYHSLFVFKQLKNKNKNLDHISNDFN